MLLKSGQLNSEYVKYLRNEKIQSHLQKNGKMYNIAVLVEVEPNEFLEILTKGKESAVSKMKLWKYNNMCISVHYCAINSDGSLTEPLAQFSEYDVGMEIARDNSTK